MNKSEAIESLEEAGAENEIKEDQFGDTKAGWWMDTVYLSKNPIEAWGLLNG